MIPETDPTAINVQGDAENHRIKGITYHGDIDFDMPVWSYIDKNLWQGGYIAGVQLTAHFRHLISLYPWEKYKAPRALETEMYVVMYDDVSQDLSGVDAVAHMVNKCRAEGPTLVHCQAGLNRSSLVVARALYLSGDPAFDDGEKIVNYLRAARSPAALCNPAFEAEVLSWHNKRRWMVVGWENDNWRGEQGSDNMQPIMLINGKGRVYHDLKHAEQARVYHGPHIYDSEGDWVPSDAENRNRVVELDFTDSTVQGRWV